jgi:uncharacterized membrane protein (DUF485 family)
MSSKHQDTEVMNKWSPPYWPITITFTLFLISALSALFNLVIGTILGVASLVVAFISFEIWRRRNPITDSKSKQAAKRMYRELVTAIQLFAIISVVFLLLGIVLLLLAVLNVI